MNVLASQSFAWWAIGWTMGWVACAAFVVLVIDRGGD